MRLLVTGGRDYGKTDEEEVCTLLEVLDCLIPDEIVHGDAQGADKIASDWVERGKDWGFSPDEIPCPADWDKHGKSAGPIRNQRMLDDHHPDLVLAVRGGRGTADMVRRALKAGVPVLRLEDGK